MGKPPCPAPWQQCQVRRGGHHPQRRQCRCRRQLVRQGRRIQHRAVSVVSQALSVKEAEAVQPEVGGQVSQAGSDESPHRCMPRAQHPVAPVVQVCVQPQQRGGVAGLWTALPCEAVLHLAEHGQASGVQASHQLTQLPGGRRRIQPHRQPRLHREEADGRPPVWPQPWGTGKHGGQHDGGSSGGPDGIQPLQHPQQFAPLLTVHVAGEGGHVQLQNDVISRQPLRLRARLPGPLRHIRQACQAAQHRCVRVGPPGRLHDIGRHRLTAVWQPHPRDGAAVRIQHHLTRVKAADVRSIRAPAICQRLNVLQVP
mmetsp:Transcript_3687/g.10677  ORF Transcript_3687/g.10677 Transcript_3687/m.10677 type:complete len:312 (-) Transcript_3687:4655-5590(-)